MDQQKEIAVLGISAISNVTCNLLENCPHIIFFRVGAVGFISVLFPFLLPLGIVKIDEDTGEPVRGSDGLAIPCEYGEAGELVGRIDKGHPVWDYHGYANHSSTKKKIMRDVLNKGDMCFR